MPLILHNDLVRSMCLYVRQQLQDFSALRLFANDVALTPATPNDNLIDPVGSTYEVKSLSGTWTVPQKAIDGVWYTESAEVTYAAPLAEPWSAIGYCVVSATGLRFSARFPAPVVMTPTSGPYRLRVRFYQASLPSVCADPNFFGN